MPIVQDLSKGVLENTLPTEKEENLFRIGPSTFEALGDRVLVLVDPFKSGYECQTCSGKQKITCENCHGKGKYSTITSLEGALLANALGGGSVEKKCSSCDGKGEVTCPDCEGKGVEKGGIIIPEKEQNRPESGTIVSVGEYVGMGVHRLFGSVRMETRDPKQKLKIGDKVLFGRYSGHNIDLETTTKEKIILRILNESEVLMRITGHLELRRLRKDSREQIA